MSYFLLILGFLLCAISGLFFASDEKKYEVFFRLGMLLFVLGVMFTLFSFNLVITTILGLSTAYATVLLLF